MGGMLTANRAFVAIVMAGALAIGILAGCGRREAFKPAENIGSAGGEYAAEPMSAPVPEIAARSMDEVQVAATGDTAMAMSVTGAAEAAVDRKVIHTAELDVEVENLDEAQQQLIDLVDKCSGFIASLTVNDYETSRVSEIVVRVPSDHFHEVYEAVKALGRVERDHIAGQDVTEEYMDLERRIANKQAEEARVREMFDEAKTVEDLLKIEQRLSEVRMEIESYQGRLRYLKDQVRYSTLTITLTEYGQAAVEESGGWRLDYHLRGAFHALVNALRGIVVAIIYIAIPGAVVWIPLLIIIALIRRALRRRRERTSER